MTTETLSQPRVSPLEEFIQRGYTLLPIDHRAQLAGLYDYFVDELLSLDDKFKRAMIMDYSGKGRPDHGLYRREDNGDDWKWIFHYRPWDPLHHVLSTYQDRAIPIPGFVDWCREVDEVASKYLACLVDFARQVDEIGGYRLAEELLSPTGMAKHVVRFIYYDPNQPSDDLASKHGDFGLLTFAGYETNRGLWLDDRENLYEVRRGETLLFSGRKCTESTKEEIPAVCHGVIKTPDFDSTKSRGSVVLFYHGDGEKGPSCPS